jgi:hypothetical protein
MGSINCKTCKCTDEQEMVTNTETEGMTNIPSEDIVPLADSKPKLIEEARRRLKNDINIIFNYKSESKWDLIFNSQDNKEATVNGLFNLKKNIIEFYSHFFNYSNTYKGTIYEKLVERDLVHVTTRGEFNARMKELLLKNMNIYFKIYGLEKMLKDITIELSNHENIEKFNSMLKNGSIPNINIDGKKEDLNDSIVKKNKFANPPVLEIVYEQSRIETDPHSICDTTKANTKMTEGDKKGILPGIVDLFSLFKTKKPVEMKQEEDIKRKTDEIKMHQLIKKTSLDRKKSDIISRDLSASNMESDKDLITIAKKIKKTLLKTRKDYELNIIQEGYDKEEGNLIFISFFDKRANKFYEGYWHITKHCKYGLGVEYSFGPGLDRYKYFGYFKEGKYHGVGIMLREHDYSYLGEFRQGKYSGYGHERGKTFLYKGFFKDGQYCGFGEYSFLKTSYTGCYCNGLKEGIGYAHFEDGCSYIGSYKGNLMDGIGLYRWPDGHMYYGPWKDDKKTGVGLHKWSSGDVYLGNYKNDLKDGNGEYTFKNGYKLIGTWINGKKENYFSIVDKNKTVYHILYKNDIQIN